MGLGGCRFGQNRQPIWDHKRGLIIDTIRASNICYSINKRPILAQKGSLSINRHDLVCINGPSGGGKTTLLNILSGLCKSSGEVLWGDINIKFTPENFDKLYDKVTSYLQEKDIYVRDSYACADPKHRLNIRVVTEYPWSNQFAWL